MHNICDPNYKLGDGGGGTGREAVLEAVQISSGSRLWGVRGGGGEANGGWVGGLILNSYDHPFLNTFHRNSTTSSTITCK